MGWFRRRPKKHTFLDALIGARTRVEKDCLKFGQGLHIDGFVGVDIVGTGNRETALSISEDGEVAGNVQADTVWVAGTVRGNIVAKRHGELLSTARVSGRIEYQTMEQADGAIVQGSTRKTS